MPPISRRRWLEWSTASSAAALASGCVQHGPLPTPRWPTALAHDAFAEPESPAEFPLGVMAGDATDTRAVLWTRYAYAGRGTLALRVLELRGGAPGRVVFHAPVTVRPDGFTHVDVTGLRPGARYVYAFVVRDRERTLARSPLGRFRAAIAPDALEPLVFGGTSCARAFAQPFRTLAHAAAGEPLDFFVFGGDHTYADGARSLDDYRLAYQKNWLDPGMQALHAAAGLYATWDDHEVGNDWNPESLPPAQLATARRAFFEHHPLRADPEDPSRIWRRFRWGRTAEIFLLDCRGERRPSTRDTDAAQYLSPAQLAWLIDGLERSDAVFKFVVNSVPIADFPHVWDVAAADRWEGYRAQRERVLAAIERARLPHVWWLAGDFHLGCVARLATQGPYRARREILMGPAAQLANPLWPTLRGPQWDFVTGANNFVRLRCDPHARTLGVEFVDDRGAVRFARRYAG